MGAIGGSDSSEETPLEPDLHDHGDIILQRYRYRIRFAKQGPLRYISHLDLARLWERVLRRAHVPLIYSQGFNPRPKIQLASGLPLGYESICELVDFWLTDPIAALDEFLERLRAVCPEGLTVLALAVVDLHAPALQSITDRAMYRVALRMPVEPDLLQERINAFLAQKESWQVRRDKPYDLRPLVNDLRVVIGTPVELEMTLALSQQRGTARPDEVIQVLGIDPTSTLVIRTAILFQVEL